MLNILHYEQESKRNHVGARTTGGTPFAELSRNSSEIGQHMRQPWLTKSSFRIPLVLKLKVLKAAYGLPPANVFIRLDPL
jgi:hypothetical protein